jgi:hypothetical protein
VTVPAEAAVSKLIFEYLGNKDVKIFGAINPVSGETVPSVILAFLQAWITNSYQAEGFVVFATTDKAKKHKGIR